MQAGKNISAAKIFPTMTEEHPYRCVGGNGLRGYTDTFNTSGNHSIVGRQGALCGCLNIENGNFYATEHAVVVDTYNIISASVMYYFLTALNLNQYATATAQPGLAVSNIIEVYFPLPPIKEQQRIINKIKSLDPLISQFGEQEKSLNSFNEQVYSQLKKSVLQEAIQGKLVPQIASEGTAESLLEEIRAEKDILIKEKKIKRDKLDSIIFKGDDNKYYEKINGQVTEIECPFDFPDNWAVVRLKDICQLTDGERKIGNGICMDAKFLRGKFPATIVDRGRYVYNGDSVILVDGENSGEVFSVPQDGYMGSTFKRLWLSSVMWKPYILSFILFYKEELRNSKRGAAIPHLNKELFYNLLIGIPPFAEQQRITERLNELSQLLK
jgi:type I restriction enzyme S subunit